MKALLLVDIQNDFLPGGALAVPEGDAVLPVAARLIPRFPRVVASQDWHPSDHGSFAANHPNGSVGEVVDLHGLQQVLWPVHCVQESPGAALSEALDADALDHVVRKGTDPKVDSYSAFFDNGRRHTTGLEAWLREQGVDSLYLLGLATDYCVRFTALDAASLGFATHLVEDGCRGVELHPGDVERALAEMKAAGIRIVRSDELEGE